MGWVFSMHALAAWLPRTESQLTLAHEAYRTAVACHVQVLLVPCLSLCFGLPSNCDAIFWHNIAHQKTRSVVITFFTSLLQILRDVIEIVQWGKLIYQNHVLSFFLFTLGMIAVQKETSVVNEKAVFQNFVSDSHNVLGVWLGVSHQGSNC